MLQNENKKYTESCLFWSLKIMSFSIVSNFVLLYSNFLHFKNKYLVKHYLTGCFSSDY
jgi:hypothetical protein